MRCERVRRAASRSHLGEEPGREHLLDALVDAPCEHGARPSQPDLRDWRRGIRVDARAEGAERSPAADGHLEGAHDPPPIGRLHLRRPRRVERGQPCEQCPGVRLAVELGTHLGPLPRQVELVDDRTEVETGPAHEQRRWPRSRSRSSARLVRRAELGDREVVRGLDEVEAVVAAPRRARAAMGLAVPMSMPRYTCMLSIDTRSTAPICRATLMATDDFPDAVDPTIATRRTDPAVSFRGVHPRRCAGGGGSPRPR